MKEFTNVRENRFGGFNADYNEMPYTLTTEEVETLDLNDESITRQSTEAKAVTLAESNRQAAKVELAATLNAMTYTFEDGRVLQVRPQDGQNFQSAIGLGADIEFICADNSIETFTVVELTEAMNAGIIAGAVAWSTYIDAIR